MKAFIIILRIIFYPVRIIFIVLSIILALLTSALSFICVFVRILGILSLIVAVIYFAVFAYMDTLSNQLLIHQLLSICVFGVFLIAAASFIPWLTGKLSEWTAMLSSALRFETDKENN